MSQGWHNKAGTELYTKYMCAGVRSCHNGRGVSLDEDLVGGLAALKVTVTHQFPFRIGKE